MERVLLLLTVAAMTATIMAVSARGFPGRNVTTPAPVVRQIGLP
jgi:hypothetical protein